MLPSMNEIVLWRITALSMIRYCFDKLLNFPYSIGEPTFCYGTVTFRLV